MKKINFSIISIIFIFISITILILNNYGKFYLGFEMGLYFMKMGIYVNIFFSIILILIGFSMEIKKVWKIIFSLYYVLMILYYFFEN